MRLLANGSNEAMCGNINASVTPYTLASLVQHYVMTKYEKHCSESQKNLWPSKSPLPALTHAHAPPSLHASTTRPWIMHILCASSPVARSTTLRTPCTTSTTHHWARAPPHIAMSAHCCVPLFVPPLLLLSTTLLLGSGEDYMRTIAIFGFFNCSGIFKHAQDTSPQHGHTFSLTHTLSHSLSHPPPPTQTHLLRGRSPAPHHSTTETTCAPQDVASSTPPGPPHLLLCTAAPRAATAMHTHPTSLH